MKNEPQFFKQTEQYDLSFPEYYNMTEKFGHWNEDGSYTVTNRHTPRQWMLPLCNKNIFSAVSNDGNGFIAYKYGRMRMTTQIVEADYLLRALNGKREYFVFDEDKVINLLEESQDLQFTVYPGRAIFSGTAGNIRFEIVKFVPLEDGVECTRITICGQPEHTYKIGTGTDWCFANHRKKTTEERFPDDLTFSFEKDAIVIRSNKVHPFPELYAFTAQEGIIQRSREIKTLPLTTIREHISHYLITEKEIITDSTGKAEDHIVVAVGQYDHTKIKNKYLYDGGFEAEYDKLMAYWKSAIERNFCTLPDKNTQHMLNLWLKYQVHVTSLYNRFGYMGYRDILQDSWGVGFVDPARTRQMMVSALENMFEDGRCPRQFCLVDKEHLDRRDFCDSPMWLPIALDYYIKETGDFAILDKVLPYRDSEQTGTFREHMLRAFDYLWNNLASNGLILMRGGDWLDGLEGINKLGEATSVWGTIATYYAQNKMIDLFTQTGDTALVEELRKRNDHYKHVVNTVGWNGKWYSYATINDNEVIGHPDNLEGRIFLLPQAWAIFSGIADEEKTKSAMRWVNLYLTTPWGPHLNYPPFVATGDGYGRLKRQRPGTFANGAIYLHAASFKVYSDVARGDNIEAYDTFTRLLPGHIDNPDSRRTGEPWAVGNVHYGIHHKNPGLNLYTWFSATPSWLIHGGFDQILGIQPTYNGLQLTPCVPPEWTGYEMNKTFRGTHYHITFTHTGRPSITMDGKKIEGNIISSSNPTAEVIVEY